MKMNLKYIVMLAMVLSATATIQAEEPTTAPATAEIKSDTTPADKPAVATPEVKPETPITPTTTEEAKPDTSTGSMTAAPVTETQKPEEKPTEEKVTSTPAFDFSSVVETKPEPEETKSSDASTQTEEHDLVGKVMSTVAAAADKAHAKVEAAVEKVEAAVEELKEMVK